MSGTNRFVPKLVNSPKSNADTSVPVPTIESSTLPCYNLGPIRTPTVSWEAQ
ncbi:hypothetical protein L209DRAFT_747243 [Thermothelomyces heterothallicus CBS 203.75]